MAENDIPTSTSHDAEIDFLIQQLRNWKTRESAITALTEKGEVAVLPLIDLFVDDNPKMRLWAALILGEIGGDRALQALKVVAQYDLDRKVRDIAKEGSDKILQRRSDGSDKIIQQQRKKSPAFAAIDSLYQSADSPPTTEERWVAPRQVVYGLGGLLVVIFLVIVLAVAMSSSAPPTSTTPTTYTVYTPTRIASSNYASYFNSIYSGGTALLKQPFTKGKASAGTPFTKAWLRIHRCRKLSIHRSNRTDAITSCCEAVV